MKAIMVMFDTLNRHFLPPYGNDWVHAPNFTRLAGRSMTFDRAFIGSFPTMPARRELHTGRYNFLHRGWGPLEPFDDSMPQALRDNGVHSHLVTDGFHYFEDGGATYHNRYRSWEGFRGQQGDLWRGVVAPPRPPESPAGRTGVPWDQDWVNRSFITDESAWPQARTFAAGLAFMERNRDADNWFLQIETFDPHEPFFAPQRYRDLYPHAYDGGHFDWPRYVRTDGVPAASVEHVRCEYAALLSMCDASLGRVLDAMDAYGLWDDTMLIVATDHGFLLGEHGWFGKGVMPPYNEVARVPLFIWDPRAGAAGVRCPHLVQAIDFAPTLLELFGLPFPRNAQGRSLKGVLAGGAPLRHAGLFGGHGGYVCGTDGRYVYMRANETPDNTPLYEYTLMPTRIRGFLSADALAAAGLVPPFDFTGRTPVLKVPAAAWKNMGEYGHLLFDLDDDPGQERPLHDPAVEERMKELLVTQMKASDAPPEQFERLGLAGGAV